MPGSTGHAIGRERARSGPPSRRARRRSGIKARPNVSASQTDGTLRVQNGSGGLFLASAANGDGQLVAGLNLTLSASGAIELSSNGQILPVLGYRENLGALNRKYLSLHAAELWVETLVAQQTLATIGGRILVGPTTTLTRDVLPGDATIYVKHNAFALHVATVEYGSKLVLEAAGKFEVLAVTSQTTPAATAQGDYAFDVARAWGGSANAWYAGDAVFDTGKAGGGPVGAFLDLYSVRGVNAGSTAGPTIVGNVRVGGAATAWREHWAIGNLQGVYGNTARLMGAAFGDTNGTHLQIDSTTGIAFLSGPGQSGVSLGRWSMDGIITLGYGGASQIVLDITDGSLRMKYAGADKIVLQSDGNAYLNCGLVCGAFGGTFPYVRSQNALAYNNGRGFYFGYDTSTGLAYGLLGSVASPARYLQWNGSTLKMVTDGLTLDENGITVLQGAGTAVQPGRLIRFGTSGMYFWDTTAGNAGNGGNGEGFWVRQTGNLSMTAIDGISSIGGAAAATSQSAYLTVGPTAVTLGGQITASPFRPPLLPANDSAHDLGSGSRRWRYIWSNNLMLGVQTAAFQLELNFDSATKPTSTTWRVATARAVTRDIAPVDPGVALALVRRVPVVRFAYTGDYGTPAGERAIGVIADDLEPILPASVSRRPDTGIRLWDAHELFTLNVAAVQALAARVEALERQKDRPYDA